MCMGENVYILILTCRKLYIYVSVRVMSEFCNVNYVWVLRVVINTERIEVFFF